MTDQETLLLAQWFSPGFPVGAFAYSHGLETAIREGGVSDAASLELWLSEVLEFGAGRTDAIFVRAAWLQPEEAPALDQLALAYAASAERVTEARDQGHAFARAVRTAWGTEVPDLLYPVAVGVAGARHQVDLDRLVAMYLHAFAANLVSAAVRAVPLGQSDGQGVLARLAPLALSVAAETKGLTPEDIATSALAADIAAMRHERDDVRVFRT